jgi:hypothetical protein
MSGGKRMIKVFKIKERPLTLAELVQESGLVGSKLDEGQMKKRVGPCECGCLDYILLPVWSKAVKEGGKRYMNCVNCGRSTHL